MKRKPLPNKRYNKSPITSVHPERIRKYAKSLRKRDGPTHKDFQLALDRSDADTKAARRDALTWNTRAADVFTKSFLKSELYECQDEELITETFLTHINTLRAQFKAGSSQMQATELATATTENASVGRRRSVSLFSHDMKPFINF